MKNIPVKSKTGIVFAIVSDEDAQKVSLYKWYLDRNGYAVSRFSLRMHRLVMESQKGQEVDHINRDKLDNRRQNLRHVTHHENTLNRTQTGDGVSFRPNKGTWRARIKIKGKERCIGHFKTEQEAIIARTRLIADPRAVELLFAKNV